MKILLFLFIAAASCLLGNALKTCRTPSLTQRTFKPAFKTTSSVPYRLAEREPRDERATLMTRNLFLAPQALFAAGCSAAVFFYVLFNIDEIKAKQKIAVDKAMAEQSVNIKNAEDAQKAAIAKAKAQQEANIAKAKKIAEDAQKGR